jgi:hypothetical protein
VCAFVAAVTFSSDRFLTTIRDTHTYIHTGCWEGFMKYAVEVGSGAMIYIPSSIKIGSGILKLIEWIHRHTDRMEILSFTRAQFVVGSWAVQLARK